MEDTDGFHTRPELYTHRHALFIALARSHKELAWRAWEHGVDGPMMYEGYFIAGMNLPHPWGQVSYHLPVLWWPQLHDITTLPYAPAFDGHTSDDVVVRLVAWGQTL